MSSNEPQLRSLPRSSAPGRRGRGDRAIAVALGIALAVALVLLIWNRSQSSSRIAELEARNSSLVDELAAREALVQSQQQRLSDVRTGVHGLMKLLDRPLGESPEKP